MPRPLAVAGLGRLALALALALPLAQAHSTGVDACTDVPPAHGTVGGAAGTQQVVSLVDGLGAAVTSFTPASPPRAPGPSPRQILTLKSLPTQPFAGRNLHPQAERHALVGGLCRGGVQGRELHELCSADGRLVRGALHGCARNALVCGHDARRQDP